jgi:diguanylate cyclase (GGDEF)-like protein
VHSPLGPRDQRSAALTAGTLLAAGGGAVLLDQAFSAVFGGATSVVGVAAGAAFAVVGIVLVRWRAQLPDAVWVVFALASLGLILGLNLATNDTGGGGAQLGFLFPVVYAGAFLRPAAAWTVAVGAAVSSAASVFLLLPPERAWGEYPFLLVSIVTLTAVLLASGRRQDRLVAQLDALASVDSLTGLATRRALGETAAAVLAVAPDEAPEGTGLMLVDVDRFKAINDTFGHPVGDAVLTHLGQMMRAAVRRTDTVARFGGDELAVLLPNTSVADARRRAEELRLTIRETPLRHDTGVVQFTVSVGVAHMPVGHPDLQGLYVAADQALYRAKHHGRDQVVMSEVHP